MVAPNSTSQTSHIGRYELKSKAGEGASGVVYRAHDPLLEREVAIKLAKANSLSPEEVKQVVKEFYHEAAIAGKFSHANIITIYDVVSDGTFDYIVMEYMPGRSVQDYMEATGPLDIDEALSITYKCCLGLEYIHYHGIIHRDIKPGNIMYHPVQGVVKLMDFSVAHKIEADPPRDTGTIAYMAPEHFDRDRKITKLIDIFALGSTMYRILTGEYPFDSRHTAFQILHQDPEPITNLRPEVPEEIVKIVNKAMAKEDADRYQSADEFAQAVETALTRLYPQSNLVDTSSQYLAIRRDELENRYSTDEINALIESGALIRINDQPH
ncbi:MAG: serine/threonine protein kinase [Gammaproteobacteria bacterium]|nr:MAG: serine/threonine protein kinase [Gammaproteobacteria bacterium]